VLLTPACACLLLLFPAQPWNGSEEWTRKLGYPVSRPWTPWMASAQGREWTAGFSTLYNTKPGFAFTTVKHAGHVSPQ
jgi:hypothetical protein